MNFVEMAAFFGITFVFLMMFEKFYTIYNLPKKVFAFLRLKETFVTRLVMVIILAMITELLIPATGDFFLIPALNINLLRIFMLAFIFSLFDTKAK